MATLNFVQTDFHREWKSTIEPRANRRCKIYCVSNPEAFRQGTRFAEQPALAILHT
jgi:hypothetical protein